MDMKLEAQKYFDRHFNCAQSVFAPFALRFGMDLDTALKIATPFGGGMGHAGQVCGAVSGGLMAIGLVMGIASYDREKKYACYELAQEFQDRFWALHGEITCPRLLGYDIGDPEELKTVRELNLFHTLCPKFVGDAAELVDELINL
jgi:C_GCAxxG_C_C family probable redox protein